MNTHLKSALVTLKKYWWYISLLFFILVSGAIAIIIYSEKQVNDYAAQRLYDDVESIPENNVGLLLGVNKYASSGRMNLFYSYRIDATVELYESGKIKRVLISGDNSTQNYDEPTTMKDDLVERGIPEEDIFLDYAGFRTWDSVVRANKVFGQESFTVISQEFHNERAVYIAKMNGINAVGFDAKDVPVSRSPRVWLRERLARVNVVMDVWFNTEPKFLGEPIVIPTE